MTESPDDTLENEEQTEQEAGADANPSPGELPVVGGYFNRDPKTEMPVVPTRPDAEDDDDE